MLRDVPDCVKSSFKSPLGFRSVSIVLASRRRRRHLTASIEEPVLICPLSIALSPLISAWPEVQQS